MDTKKKDVAKTYDEFVSVVDERSKEQLEALRSAIMSASDEISEKIAWGAPAYYYKGKFLVQIATVKVGVAFYITPATKASFKKELAEYRDTSKNAIQFYAKQEIPKELIKNMTQFRIKEISSK
ncbi:iron chaperone [Breznakia pachnodae]|uniref:Uncharacterized protein YdhG (YjbR/CyaY superfamily) n=1 Tax=Breznakia pachnodae TaxID=265178 RepID=A0ABU0E4Y3_9FIRM|nr:DUF1801 domain-containing protein [Breznakia pachnodae]MDQ0361963.1 uncharacterized protein YdhG (YjbR/CyaY superfamily) [Breznakia pachnodae]